MQELWGNLPAELRNRHQWCVTVGSDDFKKPLYFDGIQLREASILRPETWMTFNAACHVARHYGYHIGYVLTESDNVTVIDLDIKDADNAPDDPKSWTSDAQKEAYKKLITMLSSYTEYSRSGKAYHILLQDSIGKGARYGQTEVYSQARFMICTGNVIINGPMLSGGDILKGLVHDIRARQTNHNAAVELLQINEEEEHTDNFIIELASNASNYEKFNALCNSNASYWQNGIKIEGSYTDMGYPTQSEADTALIAMLCFYSQSNAQVKRLFRYSGLGKREKATQDDVYLDRTLKLIRSRQLSEWLAEERVAEESAKLAASFAIKQPHVEPIAIEPEEIEEFSVPVETAFYYDDEICYYPRFTIKEPVTLTPAPAPVPNVVVYEEQVDVKGMVKQVIDAPTALDFPAGRLGQVMEHIYTNSPRPVKQISIATGLGLAAGLCGRSYNISQSGLNLYIIVIARSAVGKETLHNGLSQIAMEINPALQPETFIDFTKYASGPALLKNISSKKSVINIIGEFGRRMQEFNGDQPNSGASSLKTVITDLYQKSGRFGMVGGLAYSNKDNNAALDSSVAYSLIGESTPETFYGAMTASMMEDGFMSRFTAIEYDGDRVPLNSSGAKNMRPDLVQYIEMLATRLQQTNIVGAAITDCTAEPAVRQAVSYFENLCDERINSTTDESERQLWNRASLKVLRMSALLAVFDDYVNPKVLMRHYLWALNVVMTDIKNMYNRKKAGDIGSSDISRSAKVLKVCEDYLKNDLLGVRVNESMRMAGVIPRSVLIQATSKIGSFTTFRFGISKALDNAIIELVQCGNLREVPAKTCNDKFKFTGKAYYIIYT